MNFSGVLRRWPVRLVIAGLALVVALRVAGGLLLDSFVAWESGKRYGDRQLVEGLVLGSPPLFGRAALPALERILERHPGLRYEAYSAIARLGPERAWRLLDERAAPPARDGWWRPPRPSGELLGLLGIEAQPGASAPAAEEPPWRRRWQMENSCACRGDAGSPLVVFRDEYLGGSKDLWLYRPERPELEAAFIGALLGREYHPSDFSPRCVWLEGGTLEISWLARDEAARPSRMPPPPVRLPLAEIQADSDGDGLSDRVEARLRTDPGARDSDGDGLEDQVDPSPNGGRPPNPESVDAAIDELLRTYFVLGDPTCRWGTPLFLVSERRPERWARSCGPTINLPASEVERQPDGMTLLVIEPYNDRWGRFGSMSTAPGGPGDLVEAVTRPEATRFLVVNDHLGSDSEGYEVGLRRRNGRWQVVWFENLWL